MPSRDFQNNVLINENFQNNISIKKEDTRGKIVVHKFVNKFE